MSFLLCRTGLAHWPGPSGFRPYFPRLSQPSQAGFCSSTSPEHSASVGSGVWPFTACDCGLIWPRLTAAARYAVSQRHLPEAGPQLSQGKARDFRSIHLLHIRPTGPDDHWVSGFLVPSPTDRTPHMQFVFLRPELCLQLPSHPASRRRSCCSARGSRSPGSPEDFHLLVTSRFAFARRLS